MDRRKSARGRIVNGEIAGGDIEIGAEQLELAGVDAAFDPGKGQKIAERIVRVGKIRHGVVGTGLDGEQLCRDRDPCW